MLFVWFLLGYSVYINADSCTNTFALQKTGANALPLRKWNPDTKRWDTVSLLHIEELFKDRNVRAHLSKSSCDISTPTPNSNGTQEYIYLTPFPSDDEKHRFWASLRDLLDSTKGKNIVCLQDHR